MADPNRLQQVFWNLLTNAVKFTSPGGSIEVSIKASDDLLYVTIKDTGKGLDPAFIPHVFERFRQADASTTRHHGGLGLGLAIVKQLTELHGGQAYVTSAGPNLGSTFTISLPALHLSAEDTGVTALVRARMRANEDSQVSLCGVKVLVLDDQPDSLSLVLTLLQTEGAEVRVAGSVEEALASLETFVPDVILSDIGMPDHDGYEFIRLVRANKKLKNIPAAALTALARAEDRSRAINAGFQTHIAKPVDSRELLAVVSSFGSIRASTQIVL